MDYISNRFELIDDRDRSLFISYRVNDTGPLAAWLQKELASAYGRECVFLDHDRLEGGVVWPERLKAEACRASVMLVLIGEGWLKAHDPETFVRRLDQEHDWVRKEIETALGAGSLIVPVLVEGAKPLPQGAFTTVPSLAPLADRQTLALRRKDLQSDLERLHEVLAARGFVRRRLDVGNSDGVVDRPFIIPAPVADFTGREDEIDELVIALTRNRRAAICAVNGMGGVGKSQLAFELARRTAERFPDGQVHLDLRGITPNPLAPEDALAELITAVHPVAQLPADLAGLRTLYLRIWRGRRALLLLDNAKDEAQVLDLAPLIPVAMLLTSRRQIVPEGGRMVRLDVLPEPQAIGLVREILGSTREVTDGEVGELVEQCGGLPLALRAAADFLLRRSSWSVAEYLAELRSRGIAALGKVESVLAFSLERLAEEDGELERRFTLLGAFPAGFDAAAVAALWQVEPPAARNGLDVLADWSLVEVEAVGRYRLHDLVRELALTRVTPKLLIDARARHSGHYVKVLARADELYRLGGVSVLEGLALFDAERANFEVGQHWAVANVSVHEDALSFVARYPNVGAHVLDLRFSSRQRIGWLEAAAAACHRLGNRRVEAMTLCNLGLALVRQNESRRAIKILEQALGIARDLKEPRGEGQVLGNLGLAWRALGKPKKAIVFYQQQLAIARQYGDQQNECKTLDNLGLAWRALNKIKKATNLFDDALTIARKAGHRRSEATILCNLGLTLVQQDDAKQAISIFEHSLNIARELHDAYGEAAALGNLGLAWEALDDVERAIGLYEQALVNARQRGDLSGEGLALWAIACAQVKRGNEDQAIVNAKEALAIYRVINNSESSLIEDWLRERGIEL